MTINEKLQQMESKTEIEFTSPPLDVMYRDGKAHALVPTDYWRASVRFYQTGSLGVAVTSKDYMGEDFDALVESIWKDYHKFVEA